jgi:hypothetical protein
MGEMRNIYAVLVGKPTEKKHLGETNVARKIILKWILKKLENAEGIQLAQDSSRDLL